MKRRQFMFGSLKAALLLSPVLSIRRAAAQSRSPKRLFIWVNCSGYPKGDDFFPTGSETNFELSPILADFGRLRPDMVVVDGIDIRNSGPKPKGNNHVRSVGKVLTAKDLLRSPTKLDGLPGGISIDQLIAKEAGLSSLELQVTDRARTHMRDRPFATGPKAFKPGFSRPSDAWDKVFGGISSGNDGPGNSTQLSRLRQKKSVLDDLVDELKTFRQQMTGIEKLKLDIHEDAIRSAEKSVSRDLDAASKPPSSTPSSCNAPEPASGNAIPIRAKAHMDLAFSALVCNRAQVIGMHWGRSGYHWKYGWVNNGKGVGIKDSAHPELHHRATQRREDFITTSKWDWNQVRTFVERLKDTPEGSGTMLDNTLVLALSHFGYHHGITRLPVILFGNAQGMLRTGRYLKLKEAQDNDKLLTSVAHLMNVNIPGIGDDLSCGPLNAL